MKKKRGVSKKKKKSYNNFYITVLGLVLLIILTILYSNQELVQLAPSQPTQVRVGVGNANPTITNLQAIPNVNLNPSPSTTDVIFTFSARDPNGANDMIDSTASAQFTNPGEPTRTGTCSFLSSSGKEKTFQCTTTINYFDKSGSWTATVSIQDAQSATATDSSTFTINLLRDISINPSIINFPTVAPEQTNILSVDTTTITNNGNFEAPPGSILATANDLIGETNPAETLPASIFKVAGSSTADVCGAGSSLLPSSPTTITSSTLPRGPSGSNTETLSYCLTLVPDITSQFYSATGGNSWVIAIN